MHYLQILTLNSAAKAAKKENKAIQENNDRIYLIDKPAGITSCNVVTIVRRFTGIKKVGHAGTLDPFATGLLIVCTGKATKQVEKFMCLPKEYESVIILGKQTDTYDVTGTIVDERPVPHLTIDDLVKYCRTYIGTIPQLPPMYSAIKRNGVPLYKLARRGIEVSRDARQVTIHAIEILWFESPRACIRLYCGKGTYVRSLVHDLGCTIGCGAYVEALRRTKIGDYSVTDALLMENFQ